MTFIKQGNTDHFIVFYDSDMGQAGASLADAVLQTCEKDYNWLQDLFGHINIGSLPFKVYLKDDIGSLGNPSHAGCFATDIWCSVTSTVPPDLAREEVLAEVAEVFMANQGAGWDCIANNGEALSRVLALEMYPSVGPGGNFGTTDTLQPYYCGSNWLNGGRPDWVDSTYQSDSDRVSIGCAALFINWLRHQLGFDLGQIVRAGGTTLATTCKTLTGWADGWSKFINLINYSFPGPTNTLPTDNPFPIPNIPNGVRPDGILVQAFSRGLYGPTFVIFGEARFQIPDPATQTQLFPIDPANPSKNFVNPLNNGVLAGIGGIPKDGTYLREEKSSQVWVMNFGKKEKADPAYAAQAHTLWKDALALIPTCENIVEGKVTDTEGAPIMSASVDGIPHVETDSYGNYSSPPIPPGVYDVRASCGGFITRHASVTVAEGVPVTTQNFTLERAKAFTVKGKVTDTKGIPINGATVRLFTPGFGILHTQTDSAGLYSITEEYPDYSEDYSFGMDAFAPGFKSTNIGITVTNGATITQDFPLVRLSTLTGKVTDTKVLPISGALVMVGKGIPVVGAPGSMSGWAHTDPQGLYTITVDPPGQYYAVAVATGYESSDAASVTLTADAITTHSFPLVKAAPGAVTGKVTDPDGSPISGATVYVLEPRPPEISTKTDASGNYTLSNVLSGLTQIRALLSDEYEPEIKSAKVIAGQTITVDFRLSEIERPGPRPTPGPRPGPGPGPRPPWPPPM